MCSSRSGPYHAFVTLIALPIFVPSIDAVDHVLERAVAGCDQGARLIEWRADQLAMQDSAVEAITRLVRDAAAPSILTIRAAYEGGRYTGGDHERLELIRRLIESDSPPRYIDLELRCWLNHPHEQELLRRALESAKRDGSDRATGLILSAHDFEARPRDLLQKIEAMTDAPACDVIKIAWRARSLRDNLEVFDLLRERRKPTIALAMGEFGLPSRVLAPKFGGFLTFATDAPSEETAPGQPAIRDLIHQYRFDSLSRATAVYGVIGWPVGHSRSPELHNALFRSSEHDAVFLPLPVPSEYEHFKATLSAWLDHEALDFRGASVTIPHKENLVRFVRERGGVLAPAAERIGAANTLVVRDGVIEAHNTDAPAVVDALCEGMGTSAAALRDKRIAVLGAGGVARAAVSALAAKGAKLIIFNRTAHRAEELASMFHGSPTEDGGQAHVVKGVPGREGCGCFDIVINATAVGMTGGPAPDESPLPEDVLLDRSVTVLDTVYTPTRTPLVKQAEEAGARAIFGDELFLRQAALQSALWTGSTPGLQVMRTILAEPVSGS
ncbi:MAG: type I 3-dehydroquinate dehydratase [Phycisphaerales bacterium]|nr:MAG: type I 3-dehydroquinate dehydratase [Phycisphaerales bacterium]